MPDPLLTLDHAQVKVAPGSQASIHLTVRSTSSLVEGFDLDVLGGVPGQWTEIIPPVVDVYPGEEATAVVVFAPPSGTGARSGSFPFAVRAKSTESIDDSAVVEGDVEVGQIEGLQAKLVPVTSTGRWRGRHTVQITNRGNAAAELHMIAHDLDEGLGFYLHPRRVELEVGEVATVRMGVRARRPRLHGGTVRLPFQIVGEPVEPPVGTAVMPYASPGRPIVDGAFQQKPILNKVQALLLALLLVGLAAGVVWLRTHPQDNAVVLETLGRPTAPQNVTTTATGATRIRVDWAPMPQVSGFKVLQIDPGDQTTVDKATPVDRYQNLLTVGRLEPTTKYCFAVEALRGTDPGPRSAVACTVTRAATVTASPTPSATPTPTPSASPTPSGGASGGASSAAPVPGAPSSSGAAPAPTAPASQATSAPTTASARDLWLLAYSEPQDTTDDDAADAGLAAASADEQRLRSEHGLTNIAILDTTRYPKLTVNGSGLKSARWLVAVGPYAKTTAADADCLALTGIIGSESESFTCRLIRPLG